MEHLKSLKSQIPKFYQNSLQSIFPPNNNNTDTEIIRLIDYNIKPGVYTQVESETDAEERADKNNDNDKDEWPLIFEKILAADM